MQNRNSVNIQSLVKSCLFSMLFIIRLFIQHIFLAQSQWVPLLTGILDILDVYSLSRTIWPRWISRFALPPTDRPEDALHCTTVVSMLDLLQGEVLEHDMNRGIIINEGSLVIQSVHRMSAGKAKFSRSFFVRAHNVTAIISILRLSPPAICHTRLSNVWLGVCVL